MRILAIRGENLASLDKPFEIDLTAEPLAGTGLFAIIGDTGSGKSTILDALCLALYGEYPRVAVRQQENVPDAGGHTISAKDARGILRRGAGQGFAEVDFVGIDGLSYRVRWQVARARGKAGGRLQTEQRLLSRLDDGAAIASAKTPVREAVEARTGLTFEQFRRTVLLAQGEFDAFLLASEDHRADLLEKITGTAIYGAISQRVYDGTRQRRIAVDLLEDRRGQIGLMAADIRAGLIQERAGHETEVVQNAGELTRLVAAITHAESLVRTRASLGVAETALSHAREAGAAASDDRARLARLEAVEPLRPRLEAVRFAASRQAEALRLAELARQRRDAAQDAANDAALARDATALADVAAEREVEIFSPVWAEAERLDTELRLATAEFDSALATAQRSAAAEREHAAEFAGLDTRAVELREQLAQCSATMKGIAPHAVLAERATDIAERFTALLDLRLKLSIADTTHRTATSEHQRLSALVAAAEGRVAIQRRERQDVVDRYTELAARRAALDEPALAARDGHLRDLLDVLRDARALAEAYDKAHLALSTATEAGTSAAAAGQMAKARLSEARRGEARLQAQRTEISALVDLADATDSAAAVDLRSKLVPAVPCPVCGGADHPYAAPDHAEAAIVGRIRQRRGEIDTELAAIRTQLTEAGTTAAEAALHQASAAREATAAQAGLDATARTFRELAAWLAAAHQRSGCKAPPPPELHTGTRGQVLALLDEAEAARLALAAPLAATRQLRADIDVLRVEDDRLAKAIDAADARIRDDVAARNQAERDQVKAGTLADQLRHRAEILAAELAPFLATAGLSRADLERDAEAAARQLQEHGAAFAGLRQREARLQRELHTLEPRLASARASHAAAAAAATNAAADVTGRREEADTRRADRAALLAGEPTARHRDRITATRRSAQAALVSARAVSADADRLLAAAMAELASAIETQANAAVQGAAAQAAYADAVRAAGMTQYEVEPLLATPAALRVDLGEWLGRLARAIADAEAGVATRQRDLDELIGSGAPEIDADATRAQLAAMSAEIETVRNRMADIKARLDADDAMRAKADELAGEIEEQRRELAIWQAVDSAVGSASGDKFRRFAQGVTLDQLVALANEQLAALKPRYQLARGNAADLTLTVVDRDMADEVRAVRSLSGGERFLVSLALALALSGLEGRQSFVDTLFIDEGFGSLDAETLDMAIDALETLQSHGRKVGVITHVAGMIDRITVQIRVEKRGNGRSTVRMLAA